MKEILCSIHNYTKFSGNGVPFYDLAQAGLDCGLDAIFVTDRNIYPAGHDQYYYKDGKKLLLICGEELYDPLNKESSHILSLGVEREQFNRNIHKPFDEIKILADRFNETGAFRFYEIMNAQDLLAGEILSALNDVGRRVRLLDEQIRNGIHAAGIAGTCSSHGDIRRKISYPELLSTAMNHVLIDEPLSGDFSHDKEQLLKALRAGCLFCAVDGLSSADGFAFSAEGENTDLPVYFGGTIHMKNSITLKIQIPEECTCRLFKDGSLMREWQRCRQVPFTVYEPGAYRVECSLVRKNREYAWIFTNPIYVVRG